MKTCSLLSLGLQQCELFLQNHIPKLSYLLDQSQNWFAKVLFASPLLRDSVQVTVIQVYSLSEKQMQNI